jgi:transcriptional regulator with XRE-family HTH domain
MRKSIFSRPPAFSPTYLKAWRKHRGFSQALLADMAERTTFLIWKLENQYCGMSQSALERLHKVLKTPTKGTLFDRPPNKDE